MLTATEARKLSGPTVLEMVECLLIDVEKYAKAGKRKLRTGYNHTPNDALWQTGGYNDSAEWKEAQKILTDLGYKVSFYYSDGSQFTDLYTLIEW